MMNAQTHIASAILLGLALASPAFASTTNQLRKLTPIATGPQPVNARQDKPFVPKVPLGGAAANETANTERQTKLTPLATSRPANPKPTVGTDTLGFLNIPMSPLVIPKPGLGQTFAAGDWKASAASTTLRYPDVANEAQRMESKGKITEALILWERVLDRTTCTEGQRIKARARIKELRTQVMINMDETKARKWHFLVLVYGIHADKTEGDGSVSEIRQPITENDLMALGETLSNLRNLIFEYTSGVVLAEFDCVLADPITNAPSESKHFAAPPDLSGSYYRRATAVSKKQYGTTIAMVKYKGSPGSGLPRPRYAGSMQGRHGAVGGGGYMMIPWNGGKSSGELELHEWLHQIDDLVHGVLGYPGGTTRTSDDGRGEGWVGTDAEGEREYLKPGHVNTWLPFYKHLMSEHMTRQMWSEMAIHPEGKHKPGSAIKIIWEYCQDTAPKTK